MIQRLQQKRNEEGFTLIELLIVIIVLGILAAIVVFAIGSTRKDTVAASCKTNLKAIELSAEGVVTKSGSYPSGIISGTAGAPATAVVASNANLLSGGTNGALLKAWPTSTDYALVYAQSGTSYSVQVYDADSAGAATGSALAGGCNDSAL
jgi:prepilin-type N-terminal cleavage/methylation domain-containing protein